jgi:hypothetical protein
MAEFLAGLVAIVGIVLGLIWKGSWDGKTKAERDTLKDRVDTNAKAKDARDEVDAMSNDDVRDRLRDFTSD